MPLQRISVVHGGHEHILQTAPDRAVLGRHGLEGVTYVLAVGSLSRHKNLGAISDAMRILGERDWVYVLAGGGNARRLREEEGGWPAGVRTLGYVTDGELRALYEQPPASSSPRSTRASGYPPLEAMACGCPVIASRARPRSPRSAATRPSISTRPTRATWPARWSASWRGWSSAAI